MYAPGGVVKPGGFSALKLLTGVENFRESHGARKARENPKHRNDCGVPERHAHSLRQQKARIGRCRYAQDRIKPGHSRGRCPWAVFTGFRAAPERNRLQYRHDAEHRENADTDKHPA